MRTLVYCTAYADTSAAWQSRYRPWLDAVQGGGLNPDQILIVDDGSPMLPGWADTQLFSGDSPGEGFTVGPRGPVLLFHFRQHLGRVDMHDFPGWHRSYVFGALYAEANGFDRVIHLESDAFLISDRARAWATGAPDGWAALYSPRYDAPELAISVACGDGLRALAEFARAPYATLAGKNHEKSMPFTHVEKGLKGDRYGESSAPVPPDADYAAQVPARREPGYYWWLPGRAARGTPAHSVTLRLGEGGNGVTALDGGWADPEIGNHWMVGAESILRLPSMPGTGDAALRLGVAPFVVPGKWPRQRLMIDVNGRRCGEFDLTQDCVVGCDIPAAVLRPQGTNLVRLIHPDAVAPSLLIAKESDSRRLSVSVEWLTFEHFS